MCDDVERGIKWLKLLCYLFGEVLYDNTPRFYRISHGSNASREGHTLSSWKNRLKLFFKHGTIYYAPYVRKIN